MDEYTRQALDRATEAMLSIFSAIEATNPEFDAGYSGAGHIMGTCRMGNDPKDSVVNGDCQSHDHPNLFIVGASVFPTGGTANPTLTMAALALRAVEAVKAQVAKEKSATAPK
jgi:choline dehydrogenase-like flavoprotein